MLSDTLLQSCGATLLSGADKVQLACVSIVRKFEHHCKEWGKQCGDSPETEPLL